MSGKIEDKVKEAAGAVQEQWGAVAGLAVAAGVGVFIGFLLGRK